jgi:hypothetical protein
LKLTLVCAIRKIKEQEYTLKSSLELLKAGGYDFSHPCVDLCNSHLFLKQPLTDTEFDIPGLEYLKQMYIKGSSLPITPPQAHLSLKNYSR